MVRIVKFKLTFLTAVLLQLLNVATLKSQSNSFVIKCYKKTNKIEFRLIPTNLKNLKILYDNNISITRKNLNDGQSVTIFNGRLSKPANDSSFWKNFRSQHGKEDEAVSKKLIAQLNTTNTKDLEKKYLIYFVLCNSKKNMASVFGQYFADSSDLVLNQSYEYTFHYDKINLKSSIVIPQNNLKEEQIDLNEFKGKFKNGIAQFNFSAKGLSNHYFGYYIERSTDKVAFQKVNSSPLISIFTSENQEKQILKYSDSLKIKETTYYYRLRGVNFLGELSASSNVIQLYNHTLVKSNPYIDTIFTVKNSKIVIHYSMFNKNENDLIKKFLVYRSETEKDNYKLVHFSSKAGDFSDTLPNYLNYYKVAAVTAYDTLYSFSRMKNIDDTIPPVLPKNFRGSIDKNGLVTLNWNANSEKDFWGYKIFKANTLYEQFLMVNSLLVKDTLFKDKLSLDNLSSDVYYKIVSVDKTSNNSKASEAILIIKPDTIPPARPSIINFKATIQGVVLKFLFSTSTDVSKHILFREVDGLAADTIKVLHKTTSTKTNMVDTTAIAGLTYTYYLCAVDKNKNKTNSNKVTIINETGFRPAISDIKYTVDREKNFIMLNWNYTNKDIERIVIYRAFVNEAPVNIKTINGSEKEFVDKNANPGNIYEYRLKAIFTNGAETLLSKVIKVEY